MADLKFLLLQEAFQPPHIYPFAFRKPSHQEAPQGLLPKPHGIMATLSLYWTEINSTILLGSWKTNRALALPCLCSIQKDASLASHHFRKMTSTWSVDHGSCSFLPIVRHSFLLLYSFSNSSNIGLHGHDSGSHSIEQAGMKITDITCLCLLNAGIKAVGELSQPSPLFILPKGLLTIPSGWAHKSSICTCEYVCI